MLLRNLEIGTQFRDSENALRNLEIAQIPKLRGTYILSLIPRLLHDKSGVVTGKEAIHTAEHYTYVLLVELDQTTTLCAYLHFFSVN